MFDQETATTHTQCIPQNRLKPIAPRQTPADLESINPAEFITNHSLGKFRGEPGLFDDYLSRPSEDVQPS